MKRFYIISIFLLSLTVAHSQTFKGFSQDTALFFQELDQAFATTISEEDEAAYELFKSTWYSLDHENRTEIMHVFELLRAKRSRSFSRYLPFMKIINEFYTNDKLYLGYDVWMSSLKTFLEDPTILINDITAILNSSYGIVSESILFRSNSKTWTLDGDNIKFLDQEGLKLRIEPSDLICYSKNDTLVIYDTEGIVDVPSYTFTGKGGRVFWDRANIPHGEVYAILNDYKVILTQAGYTADSVNFFHRRLLGKETLGTLQDQLHQYRGPENVKYPVVSTYESSFQLKDLFPGINYRGALKMQGVNLIGSSVEGENAEIEIYSNDTLRMLMNSSTFLFGTNSVRSENVEVSIYIENDSIYHPDLVFNYSSIQDIVRLTKSKVYTSQGPYSNSYHKIDLNFDELEWKRSESIMKMQAAQGNQLANGLFESYDFFDLEFYESLQGMEYQHPLADLWTYGDMLGGDIFAVDGYASYLGQAEYVVRHILMELHQLGFVYFDFEKDEVTLRPKLFDYIDASLMKRDYDVIRFVSRTTAPLENAKLDLATRDLTINGIPRIFLSDSQNVMLVPTNNQIVMKRNRDFQFDGVIDAGLFKFYGKNFFFEYDAFLINLQNIDSLSISAKTGKLDNLGNPILATLDNKIENVTGELLIDAPFNKSGLEHFPEYPIFTSRENSYVYFDEQEVQDGVYDRDRFYFELFPFSIDSLDNFRRDAMRLEGTFVSAEILPPLEMEMTLRPDNSLGFYMTLPEEGMPVYGGKGTFYNDLEMSTAGLHGYGSLDYITSTTWSDDFLFHPDSMMTTSREFKEREKLPSVSYPIVENDVTDIKFYPFKDVMHIRKMENNFKIYNDSTIFNGDLALRPGGLTGEGAVNFPDARFASEEFDFHARRINSDSSGVQLKKAGMDDFTFLTNDVKIDVSLDDRQGEFSSRDDYTLIEFPANLYETRLDQVTWFMDRDEVRMSQAKYLPENLVDIGIDSIKTNGPSYVSKHGMQDSLNFVAPIAFFNYATKVINAEKVPFIEIADTYVFPHEGNVVVEEEARITPLKEAKILSNTSSRYHDMYNGNVVITSRQYFRGSADYDYIDEFGNINTFRLTQIEVDTSRTTFGAGDIIEADSFRISPFFDYKGEIRMRADEEFLTFIGGVRLTHDCNVNKQWLSFNTKINPDSIMIPVDEMMFNYDRNQIFAGTMITRDSVHIYPTFLSPRKNYFTHNITYANGYMTYDKEDRTYEIAPLAKLSDRNEVGNYLGLQTDSCQIFNEGIIEIKMGFPHIDIRMAGDAVHDIPSNQLNMNVLLGFDFFFHEGALEMFGNEIDSIADLPPARISSRFYELAIKNLVGEDDADRMSTELGLTGSYENIPDTLPHTILLEGVKLRWNQESRSYRYKGEAGLCLVGDVQVNKKVNATIEFVERGTSDVFDIYLEAGDVWYYFGYSQGGLQAVSSNVVFNETIMNLKKKDRKYKEKGVRGAYFYSVSSNRRKQLFLDRYMMFENQGQEGN